MRKTLGASAFLALAAVLTAQPAASQAPQPPIEAYGQLPSLVAAEVSPSGDRIAMVLHDGGQSELRIIDNVSRSVTHRFRIQPMKIRGLIFGDDDHVILRASETTTFFNWWNKYEFSAAISVNLENGKSRQLLSREDRVHPAQGGLGRIVGRLDTGELLMPAWTGSLSTRNPDYDVLRADLDSGFGVTHSHGNKDTTDWLMAASGEALVREDYNQDTDTYLAEYFDGDTWQTLLTAKAEEKPYNIIALTQDETGVYYVDARLDEDTFQSLARLNFDGTEDSLPFKTDGGDVSGMLTDLNRHFLGVRYSGLLPSYDFVDPTLQSSFETVSASIPGAMIDLDSWSDDKSVVLYRVFDGFKVDYWLLHATEENKLSIIAQSRDNIPAAALGIVYTISYPARDGLEIPAVVTTPPGVALEADADLPLIVLPHGGPSAHDSFDFDWLSQFFANRGYLVLQPNFRGSTGFGVEHQMAGQGEWGGKMQDDVTDGVKAMINGGFADPDRVCIVGASYGGYAALAGGAFTPDLYKCVAAIAPVSDLAAMMTTERRAAGRDHSVVAYWERLIADGEASQSRLRSVSPSEYAEAFQAPVLLIHGEDDTVVEFDQSRIMERALKRANRPVDLVKLRGGDHWLSDSETRLATLRALDDFVSRHIPID